MTSIVVVTAGTSIPSSSRMLGERLGEAASAELVKAGALTEVTHLELRTLAADLANQLATRVPSARLREAFDAVCTADGVIAVTPVFNGSYSGLFKLFFDGLDEGVMKGRPLFFYLKALVAPHAVFAATKDWGTPGGKLDRRIARAAEEFARLVLAATPAKRDDDFEVTDFSELLGG
jgi:FMN reductase